MDLTKALKILELDSNPNPSDIKKAYRAMALRYHPDRNPGDAEAVFHFQELTEAYQFLVANIILSSPVEVGESPRIENLENIFDDLFGFTTQDRVLGIQTPDRLSVTLAELIHGGQKTALFTVYPRCQSCKGTGAAPKTHSQICTHCFGAGKIRVGLPDNKTEKICPRCDGRGRSTPHPCASCGGYGRLKRQVTQTVVLPKGMISGKAYTVATHDRVGGEKADIFIIPLLADDPVFRVENADLLCEYPVGKTLADSGGVLDFPSPWGWARLPVGKGSMTGTVVRLADQGLVSQRFVSDPLAGKKGELRVKLKVLSDKRGLRGQQEFLKKMGRHFALYRGKGKSWWQRWLGL